MPKRKTNLVPPVHLFGWEGSHCNPNGRASMVNNMEDHMAIQKGGASTASKRKAHTAIRSGELLCILKERAPYKNQGRSHSAIKKGEPTLRLKWERACMYLEDGAHTAIRMGEPTPGVVAPTNLNWESSHCSQMPGGAR